MFQNSCVFNIQSLYFWCSMLCYSQIDFISTLQLLRHTIAKCKSNAGKRMCLTLARTLKVRSVLVCQTIPYRRWWKKT